MFATLAFYFIHKLPSKEISYYWIIPLFIILPPILTLLFSLQLIKVHFFIVRLLMYSIKIFMQTIQEKPQKLLSILLAITWKLRSNSRHSILKIRWGNWIFFSWLHWSNQLIINIRKLLNPIKLHFLIFSKKKVI